MAYVATIGFFDGVHLGHRYLLTALREEAKKRGLRSAIITFSEHPQKVLQGERKPLLTTYDERMAMLKTMGVDEIFCFNFELIHTLSAEAFEQLIHDRCGVEALLMGYDHHFGCPQSSIVNLQSSIEHLRLSERPGNQHISSTKIREALLKGEIVEANEMLGYAYPLIGTVVHGKAMGRTIGFPTANIEVEADKLIPAHGVYIAQWNGRKVLLNINNTIEMYVPQFDGDLYDQSVRVELIARIRGEQHFDNLDQLKIQIKKDLLSL